MTNEQVKAITRIERRPGGTYVGELRPRHNAGTTYHNTSCISRHNTQPGQHI
jgi:hypothetical protein